MPKEKADYDKIANEIFLTDVAAELQKELGQAPPAETERVEKLKYDTFNPENPTAYVNDQIKKFKV